MLTAHWATMPLVRAYPHARFAATVTVAWVPYHDCVRTWQRRESLLLVPYLSLVTVLSEAVWAIASVNWPEVENE